MKDVNRNDIVKMVERGQRAAELADTRLERALKVAEDWMSPSRPGAQYDGPDEPTSISSKLDKLDPLRYERLVATINRWDRENATLIALILDTVPDAQRQPSPNDPPEGACINCWTNQHHYEPVSHYKDFCRWCGDFKATEGRVPPRALLRKRHAGQRVTTVDVEKALGRAG